MAVEKQLSEAAWKSFANGRGYKDGPLLKALAELAKADPPDAQQSALDAIDKQAEVLLKANKGDKELSAYLGDMDKAVARARKAAEQAAAPSRDGDEEDSPALLTSKLIPLIRQVRSGETVYAMVGTAGKSTAVLLSRKPIGTPRKKLLADYLDAKGGVKYLDGQCLLENNALTFVMLGAVGGLAKRLRAALLQQTELILKVRCRGEDGEDDDGEAAAPDDATIETPRAEAPPPGPQPTAAELAYQQRRAALDVLLQQALDAKHPESTKLRALSGFASDKAGGDDYAGAGKALDMLEKLLGAPVGGTVGGTNAALESALKAWQEARETVLTLLRGVAADVDEDRKEDPADVFLRDVEIQVNAVMRQLTAEPRTAEQIASLTRWLTDDDVVADVDAHFGNVRAPLVGALAGIGRALGMPA